MIVDRGSHASITENVAASVRLVQDGARVLNWSWGLHRLGARRTGGTDVDSSIRSGVAFEGYEELLEEFFLWLRREYPDVIVVNSAGNGRSFAGNDDYRLALFLHSCPASAPNSCGIRTSAAAPASTCARRWNWPWRV